MDGATGTEIERRSAFPAAAALPLWSTHALLRDTALLREIHRDYVRAGAEILTANTFRTQRRTLARAGLGERSEELTARAVAIARAAAEEAAPPGRAVLVAGSQPTLEDCYHPERVPEDDALAREHAEHARALVRAGVDFILVETINTQREGVAALRAAREAGLPACVSFVCAAGGRLLSGEPLSEAVAACVELGPLAVLVNCLPAGFVSACLPALRSSGLPFGVYPNLGAPDAVSGFRRSDDCAPEQFATLAESWLAAGARLVGGCCGTTPAHIAALARRLDP
ncbi:MAG TPA: homocysteine S-methyltransferase family protein [Myxococcota bacterium]|nr:homocysteine S-methyltransferase family protein [Myxococcota bacterium]